MMITPRSGTSRRFQELGRQQCYELLAIQEVGWVAWQAADGLQILPVTYALFEGAIYFRTSPHSIVSELAQRTEVAFEVDELDQERRAPAGGGGPRQVGAGCPPRERANGGSWSP